jgi:hypothetical protein
MYKITYDLLTDLIESLKSENPDLQRDMANYLEQEYIESGDVTGKNLRPNLKKYKLQTNGK